MQSSCVGTSAAGTPQGTPSVLSSYTIEDGRLTHAEMFYFDLPAVHLFLSGRRRGRRTSVRQRGRPTELAIGMKASGEPLPVPAFDRLEETLDEVHVLVSWVHVSTQTDGSAGCDSVKATPVRSNQYLAADLVIDRP